MLVWENKDSWAHSNQLLQLGQENKELMLRFGRLVHLHRLLSTGLQVKKRMDRDCFNSKITARQSDREARSLGRRSIRGFKGQALKKMNRHRETAASKSVGHDEADQWHDLLKLNFPLNGLPTSRSPTSVTLPPPRFGSLCPSQFLSPSLCFSKSQYG